MGTKVVSGANGKQGRVFANVSGNDIELCVTEWTLTVIANEYNITNSCSAGKEEIQYGDKHVEGKITMDLDLAQHPLDNPPNLQVGLFVTEIDLYEHSSFDVVDGPIWYLLDVAITQLEVSVPAAGKVTYSFSYKTGNFQNPDQTATIS